MLVRAEGIVPRLLTAPEEAPHLSPVTEWKPQGSCLSDESMHAEDIVPRLLTAPEEAPHSSWTADDVPVASSVDDAPVQARHALGANYQHSLGGPLWLPRPCRPARCKVMHVAMPLGVGLRGATILRPGRCSGRLGCMPAILHLLGSCCS